VLQLHHYLGLDVLYELIHTSGRRRRPATLLLLLLCWCVEVIRVVYQQAVEQI
jgi:hypothetical protein